MNSIEKMKFVSEVISEYAKVTHVEYQVGRLDVSLVYKNIPYTIVFDIYGMDIYILMRTEEYRTVVRQKIHDITEFKSVFMNAINNI